MAGYKLYDKNHQLIDVVDEKITKRHTSLKGVALEDGYLELYTRYKKNPTVLPGNIEMKLSVDQQVSSLKGNIVNDMSITSYGECLGDAGNWEWGDGSAASDYYDFI